MPMSLRIILSFSMYYVVIGNHISLVWPHQENYWQKSIFTPITFRQCFFKSTSDILPIFLINKCHLTNSKYYNKESLTLIYASYFYDKHSTFFRIH